MINKDLKYLFELVMEYSMRRIDYQKVITYVATGLILSGMISFFLLPKEKFSEQENRYLESFPKVSKESILDGSFIENLETYLCDHFPLRDTFMNIKTQFEKRTGKQEINEVYLAQDGYLIEKYKEPVNNEKIIRIFNSFTESLETAECQVMLVPTAITVYEDKLPAFVKRGRQEENRQYLISQLKAEMIDVGEILKQNQSQYPLYYRLDHHWTTYAAYLAYRVYCEQSGISARELADYEISEVTEEFKGTIYSKVSDYSVKGDTITLFQIPEQTLKVTYVDTGEVTDSLYALEYLDKKDKYSIFLDNIHPLIEIENAKAQSNEELVVVKDSYANCFVPFLTEYYRKIYVVDTRYYKAAVSQLVNENPAVTRVLILYNMNTIDTDLGVGGIY